jgi:hypothetical protein
VFSHTGERMTQHYAPLVGNVAVWEIDPPVRVGASAQRATSDITITDSYAEIERTTGKYDLA